MFGLVKSLKNDVDGAVTVDWIVLSAGIIALGAGAASVIFDGSNELSSSIQTQLEDTEVGVDLTGGNGGGGSGSINQVGRN